MVSMHADIMKHTSHVKENKKKKGKKKRKRHHIFFHSLFFPPSFFFRRIAHAFYNMISTQAEPEMYTF